MKRFLDLADFTREDIVSLLALAGRLERSPEPAALMGKVLGLLFMNPSLRTLASFQSGMARLGGSSFALTAGQGTWSLESRPGTVMNGAAAEHIDEAIPVLAGYCDVLGVRAFAAGENLAEDLQEKVFQRIAALCPKPLINLESAMNHPCQALADWKTLDDLGVERKEKFVLSWAYHPRALPLAVPSATVHMAAMRGMEVVVARPDGFSLPREIMDKARAAAAASGGTVIETDDRSAALRGARVLYAKEWGSTAHYGDADADHRLRDSLKAWCVREQWFDHSQSSAVLMHCLPVRRNVAVADEVLDGVRSVVQRQAANRLLVQQAVLHQLLVA